MPKKVEAFAHFGATLNNVRWSWSAVTPDGEIVLALWEELFDNGKVPTTYSTFGDPDIASWTDFHGNKERTKLLKQARDTRDGEFRVVLVISEKPDARPRQIDRAYPTLMTMKLIDLNEESGEFNAEMKLASEHAQRS